MLPQPIATDRHLPARDRQAVGRALRKEVPRGAHAAWVKPADRADPVTALTGDLRQNISHLLPIRYDRMSASPATFLRGAASIMAADLMQTPASGLWVQACGDCHLHNFGTFATPEGTPVFDINDFDETLPAPFEWDLKRLATSFVLEAKTRGLSGRIGRQLARIAVLAYRVHMRSLVTLPPLDLWRSKVNVMQVVDAIEDPKVRDREARMVTAGTEAAYAGYPHLVEKRRRVWRIVPKPPLIVPLTSQGDDTYEIVARSAFDTYRRSLSEERLLLFDRYELVDVAFKVVGVGSVGTFCAIGLFVSPDDAPLLLQIKEARTSVLAPYTRPSEYPNQGKRVVTGQRIIQAQSDIFLGWTDQSGDDQHCYVRQLKDPGLARVADELAESSLAHHATLCGLTLARAHARSGDPAAIAGYMGSGGAFDAAIAAFGAAYADQMQEDWKLLRAAIKSGQIDARPS
jgi:Uncharacterized protein conserved in bacteria (DUF2252)